MNNTMTISKGALDFIVGTVARHASTDNARPILTGIFFDPETLTVVATDSYSMATWTPTEVDGPPIRFADRPCIIPARLLADLVKTTSKCAAHTTLAFDLETGMVATPEGVTMPIRIIEGTYPPYRSLIPADRGIDGVGHLTAWNLGKLSSMRCGKAWYGKGTDNGTAVVCALLYSHPTKPSLYEVTTPTERESRVVETVQVILMPIRLPY